MTSLAIPTALHDVLGKHQSRVSLVLIAVAAATALIAATPALAGIPVWRSIVAALLIADIGAGAIANLTAGTNDHYSSRPRSRWIFLAVHVHLPVLALLLDAPLVPALTAWAVVIAAGSGVTLLAGRRMQRVASGTAFAAIVCLLPVLPEQQPTLLAVSLLFAFKVVYAFGVDHRAELRPDGDE